MTFLILDDMLDNSATRRRKPCWHRLEDVKMLAINDCLLLEAGVFFLIKKYFGGKDNYNDIVDQIREVSLITLFGESLDIQTSNTNVINFTMEKYKTIAVTKTYHFAKYLPVALGMVLAGIKDPEVLRQSKKILLEIGYLYQIQDDLIDCYGNPEIFGKIGSDIRENKCTWLSTVCMQKASEEQKSIMQECYGKDDPEKIIQVKKLYDDLELRKMYEIYEGETYDKIKTLIQETTPPDIPQEIFLRILNRIYRRI